jgi:hypothetical protein
MIINGEYLIIFKVKIMAYLTADSISELAWRDYKKVSKPVRILYVWEGFRVTYKTGFGLDDERVCCTLYLHTVRDYRQ